MQIEQIIMSRKELKSRRYTLSVDVWLWECVSQPQQVSQRHGCNKQDEKQRHKGPNMRWSSGGWTVAWRRKKKETQRDKSRGGWWKARRCRGVCSSITGQRLGSTLPSSHSSEAPHLGPRGERHHAASRALSAAATFAPHQDESARGSGATPTRGGSQPRSWIRVILSLE